MIALILAKIRKINKYVSLNMVLFNGFSSVIEKGLKFGYMAINIKHSTIFFRKVAAPTGQNDFKKIFFFSVEILFKLVKCIDIDEKHHIYSSCVMFWSD